MTRRLPDDFRYDESTQDSFSSQIRLVRLVGKGKLTPVVPAYEGVETNAMEEFIKQCSRDLIAAMKS